MRVEIEALTVRFGSVVAVRDMDLAIEPGELLSLVGPSGCGKTTTLGFVAGFTRAASGRLLFDGIDVSERTPQSRNVGLVFQDYAIYPHMTVEENIRFPLDVARVPRAESRSRVAEAAALVGVADLLGRRPHQLSGGQRQRVALARAIVKRPGVLLLDEPLSNLDAHLRVATRSEIRRLQLELGMTTVLVTHDQSEALAIADRVAVMADGAVVTLGTPDDIYQRPSSLFAARFIGSPQMNVWTRGRDDETFIRALLGPRLDDAALGADIVVGVRPEHVRLRDSGVEGRVRLRETLGRDTLLHVRVGGTELRVLAESGGLSDGVAEGNLVHLDVDGPDWHFFKAASGLRVEPTWRPARGRPALDGPTGRGE
jgi:ABC-type sugar transport system ATPase subunit